MSYITEKISATKLKVTTTNEKVFDIAELEEQKASLQSQLVSAEEMYLKRKQELTDRIAYLKDVLK